MLLHTHTPQAYFLCRYSYAIASHTHTHTHTHTRIDRVKCTPLHLPTLIAIYVSVHTYQENLQNFKENNLRDLIVAVAVKIILRRVRANFFLPKALHLHSIIVT
jgi:hypothetical protein